MTTTKEKTPHANEGFQSAPNQEKENELPKKILSAKSKIKTPEIATKIRAQADLLMQEADDIVRSHYESAGLEVLVAERNTFHDRTTDPYSHVYYVRFATDSRGSRTNADVPSLDSMNRHVEPGDFWGNAEFRFEHIGKARLVSERFNEKGERVSMFALLPERNG